METKVKILLDSSPYYKEYIRYNSYWYKILNRNPDMIDTFVKEVKEKYKLRASDKISDVIEKVDMISKFVNVLR